MSPIGKAVHLLQPGEKGIVIFTRGDRLHINPDGSGTSGNWKIGRNRQADKVIIYKRNVNGSSQSNEIYIGDFVGREDSGEGTRCIVHISNMNQAGTTDENWHDFADTGTGPVRYLQG